MTQEVYLPYILSQEVICVCNTPTKGKEGVVTQKTRDPTEERHEEDLLSVMRWNQRRKYNQGKKSLALQ